MKALSSKEWSQKLNRFVLEQILLETGYPTDPLRLINFEVKKRKGKKRNTSLYKSEKKILCGLMWYVGQCWEKCHVYKKDIWMSLSMFLMFLAIMLVDT